MSPSWPWPLLIFSCAISTLHAVTPSAAPKLSTPIAISGSGTTTTNVLATFDFDGDGHPDLVLPDHASGQVVIKLNSDGSGSTFGNSATLGFFPDSLDWVAAGNLSHSGTAAGGLPDLAVAAGGEITVEANQGLVSGTLQFTAQTVLTDPDYYLVGVAVADVDGDGWDDLLVVAQAYDGSDAQLLVYVNLGDSGPGFADPVYYDLGGPYAAVVAAGDLTGDKAPDAAVVAQDSSGNSDIVAYINDGAGNFSSMAYLAPYGVGLDSVQIGNVAGHSDGRADIFATGGTFYRTSTGITEEVDGLVVLFNVGDDTFAPTGSVSTGVAQGVTPHFPNGSAALLQYNKGGISTVAVANQDNGTITLLNFQAATDDQGLIYSLKKTGNVAVVPAAKYCSSIAVADLNGDGKMDVVAGVMPPSGATALSGDTSAVVLLNGAKSAPGAVLSVDAAPDIDNIYMGETVEFTVDYANIGASDAHNVTLGAAIPKHSTYVPGSGSSTGLGAPTLQVVKGIPLGLTWNLGTVPGNTNGKVTFKVQIAGSLVVGNSLSGNYGITSTEGADGGSYPKVKVANSLAFNPQPTAVATSTSGTTTTPGDTITYTISYQNQSTLPVAGTTLVCGVPAQTTAANIGNATLKKTTLTWSLGTLPANSSSSQTFTVTVSTAAKNNHALTGMATINGTGLTTKPSASRVTVNLPPVLNLN